MNLIDTSGVDYIFSNEVAVTEEYFLVPDVNDEVLLTELVHGRRVPANIRQIAERDDFDEVIYLDKYNEMINKYPHRSFYNMTGFGDVSILAAMHTLLYTYEEKRRTQPQLFDTSEPIVVFTGDDDLSAFIPAEFTGKNVTVLPVTSVR